ncbi:MAG TPA: hypothetical protein VGX27_02970 [Candidatus Dormibacteraeota bacterium]|nr:hypothetical protein [Candidatus Dormibacteraeota bacterium]
MNTSLRRGELARPPRHGEVLLLGQTKQGRLVRMRIPRRLRWFDALLARTFVRTREIERVAVILPEGDPDGGYQSLRVGLADRDDTEEPGFSDSRTMKLVKAVRSEWSGEPPPLMLVAGKPWPIALLAVALFLDLLLGAERLAWTLAGFYQWIPLIPAGLSAILHVGYLVLVAVTIQQLWRQGRAGYVLGALLAVVQLTRALVLAPLEYRSVTTAQFALWLTEALLFPALIAALFVVLYQARSHKARLNASAGGRGPQDKK